MERKTGYTRFVRGTLGVSLIFLVVSPLLSWGATLTIMTPEVDPNSKQVISWMISEFTKQHPDVRIVPNFLSFEDVQKKLLAAVAAGAPPDIVGGEVFYILELGKSGILTPMDDTVEKIGKEDFSPLVLDAYTLDGHLWGVPFSVGATHLWFRKDMYEEKGLTPPQTWEELENNVKQCQMLNPDGTVKMYGIAVSLGSNFGSQDEFLARVWSNGGMILDTKGEVVFHSPATMQAMEFTKRLVEYAPPGTTSYGFQEMINSFVTGTVCHTTYPFRVLTHLQRYAPELLEKDRVGVVPIPKGPLPGGKPVSILYSKAWTVTSGSKNQALAKEFISFITSGERAIRWAHSVPIHFWPPRKSVNTAEEFLNHPLIQSPLGQRAIQLVKRAMDDYGIFHQTESGVMQFEVFQILRERIVLDAIQQVVIQGMKPEDASAAAEAKIKQLVAK